MAHALCARHILGMRRYTFPCDTQALYTQDMPVQGHSVFEESTFAQHKISLPIDKSILDHFTEQGPQDNREPCLTFELYDCFDDTLECEDVVYLKGKLPIRSLLHSVDFDVGKWQEVRHLP
jgi:hypothetical protein